MSFRDFLWNYPANLKKLFYDLAPLTYIVLFSTIALLLVVYVLLPVSRNIISQTRSENYVEGVVGSVDSLNPMYLTNNQVQRDVQALIFTKLIDVDSDGNIIPSLATSWEASADNLTYTFKISDKYFWHDGKKVTADDVVFTFQRAIELANQFSEDTFGQGIPNLKISKIDDYTVQFVLSEINATFFESIAVDIVPKHILETATLGSYALTRFGEDPVGSGPYKLVKFDSGAISLEKNDLYPTPAKIEKIQFKFFTSEKDLEYAFRLGEINALSTYSLKDVDFVKEYGGVYKTYGFTLSNRKKIIFFNLRKKEYANAFLRQGITQLIDKQKLIENTGIDAVVSNSSIPTTSWAYLNTLGYLKYSPTEAATALALAGYKKDAETGFFKSSDGKILSIALTYLENDTNTLIVEELKELMEKEGVILQLIPKNYEQITKEVLASRDFELILYEIEVSVDPDQYNLWHSLKTNYPDLNISGYKYNRVDIYLERGRKLLSKNKRLENYQKFQQALINDTPAIFLYEPKFFYVIPSTLSGFDGTDVKFPSDRFKYVTNWEIK